jgi:hypothetical protein
VLYSNKEACSTRIKRLGILEERVYCYHTFMRGGSGREGRERDAGLVVWHSNREIVVWHRRRERLV